jgi:putative transposase
VVGPRAEREAVRVVREAAGLSERRACGLIGMHRGRWRYQRKERNKAALRARLRELAAVACSAIMISTLWLPVVPPRP